MLAHGGFVDASVPLDQRPRLPAPRERIENLHAPRLLLDHGGHVILRRRSLRHLPGVELGKVRRGAPMAEVEREAGSPSTFVPNDPADSR